MCKILNAENRRRRMKVKSNTSRNRIEVAEFYSARYKSDEK